MNAKQREGQCLWSLLVPGDMARAMDMVYDMALSAVHDVLRRGVPSVYFSVAVGYVMSAASLVSHIPLRRWTQKALKKPRTVHYVLKLMNLNSSQPHFKFLRTK